MCLSRKQMLEPATETPVCSLGQASPNSGPIPGNVCVAIWDESSSLNASAGKFIIGSSFLPSIFGQIF